jgi:hypothetical protein
MLSGSEVQTDRAVDDGHDGDGGIHDVGGLGLAAQHACRLGDLQADGCDTAACQELAQPNLAAAVPPMPG